MPNFQCVSIPTPVGERWRQTGVDDSGNQLRHSGRKGAPCRHCLCDAVGGEELLLGSYNMSRPKGIYWTPSPIFVHFGPCQRFIKTNEIAPIARNRLVSIRAYDHEEQCIYDLGHAGDGDKIDNPLIRALDDSRTAFINIHTAKPGCMLFSVERIPG